MEEDKPDIKLLVVLILVSSLLLIGSFVYFTHNNELDQDNELVRMGFERGHLYFMFSVVSICISTLFWGFIIFAGRYNS